MTFSDTQT